VDRWRRTIVCDQRCRVATATLSSSDGDSVIDAGHSSVMVSASTPVVVVRTAEQSPINMITAENMAVVTPTMS